MAVGGISIPGQRYQDPATGRYDTAAGHAAYQKQQRQTAQVQQPYQQAAPSYTAGGAAGAANNVANLAATRTGAAYSVDPYGYTSYNNSALAAGTQDRTTMQLQAKLAAEAEARKLANLKALAADFQNSSSPTNLPGKVTYNAAEENAARETAFARAKDQAGALAAAQLRGVQGEMAGRGVANSPLEILKSAGVMGGARGALDDIIANQLMQDLNRAGEVADLKYSGGITQRGQDINAPKASTQQALLSLFSQLY